MKSLWPKFENLDQILTPKDILRVQAEFLNQSTSNTLLGIVKTVKFTPDDFDLTDFEFLFSHTLEISAIKLNYSFTLLQITHNALEIYPCRLICALASVDQECKSEEDLESELSKVLNLPKVFSAVQSLILQSKNEEIPEPEKTGDDLPF